MPAPRLIWDLGTAYDLFVSLKALHEPSKYGLRGAWAKGVRARLPAAEREVLEQVTPFVWPVHWVHTLPEPKDGASALRSLSRIPPEERFWTLMPTLKMRPAILELLQNVAAREAWDEGDRALLRTLSERVESASPKKEELAKVLDCCSRTRTFGEGYLSALRAYYEVFFAEEEMRIRPALEEASARARDLAERLDLSALLEELSQGLRLAELPQVAELVLAPSFWSTPLLAFAQVSAERDLILFGARPPDASLVPGEVVPDALMRALKALGDPTRLRILRYLTAEPLSPTQLARRLRLRAPTVVYHLYALRMAGLVHLTLEKGDRRRYAARPKAVKAAFTALNIFLDSDEHESSNPVDGS